MRTFITLEFNTELKQKLKEVQDVVRYNSKKGRFKHPDNFHLTLKFLGETTEEIIDAVCEDLTLELKNFGSIELCFNGIGKFGTGENIRTLFIDVSGEMEKLAKLQGIVENIARRYDFKKEDRFTPHITIAQNLELNLPYGELCSRFSSSRIPNVIFEEVVIMKSEEIGRKRVYTPIEIINTKNSET